MDLNLFAEEIGTDGPVAPVGGRTQWDVGGATDPAARPVAAPAGIVAHLPDEMIVRVGAGTSVVDLDAALAEKGQTVALPAWPGATVGGVLSVGRSGLRRLGWGPVRDTLLETRFVSSEGKLIKAGGPVVKNVTGFDLCRLLVGSLGTLGVLGEVVLRVRPRPAVSRWLRGEADPFDLRRRLHRPAALLWDGRTTWVLLDGHGSDVDAQVSVLGSGFAEVDGPPPLPTAGRESVRPSALPALSGEFLAEVGVGIVHRPYVVEPAAPHPSTLALQGRIKTLFDPAGRLNPGRTVLGAAA